MSEGSKQSNQSDIWTEIANRAREAERRAFERRRELEFVSETNQRISELARTMWEADGKPPGQVLDYWLKAEEEVLGQVLGPWRQRMQEGAYGTQESKALGDWLQALSAAASETDQRISELTRAIWEAGGKPPGQALDYWLKAEEEVLGPWRQRMQEGAYGIWGKALGDWLQAQQAIFELMREMAESNWKAAGEPPGRLLEFLLEAAKQVSDSLKRQRMPNKK